MSDKNKKQFSLTLLVRVLLGVLVVTSIGIFAYSVMRYNALMEEQKALQDQLSRYHEMREELEEILNSEADYDYIVKIAKEKKIRAVGISSQTAETIIRKFYGLPDRAEEKEEPAPKPQEETMLLGLEDLL